MTRFLQLLLIFALAFLVVTSLKAAETRQIYSKQHPYWAVACYITVDDKKFSHCTMSADYNKEEDFYYMVTRWGYQEIKILNWDWKGMFFSYVQMNHELRHSF